MADTASLTHYLCVGPYCWGKSTKLGLAVAAAKRNYPSFAGRKTSFMGYDIYKVAGDAYVSEDGRIVSTVPVVKLREVRWVGETRTVKEINYEVPQS